jgi:hypothetical protein
MTPAALVGLLAEPARLPVPAAIVLGAQTPAAVTQATGLETRDVVRAVQRLVGGGLVTVVDGQFGLDVEVSGRRGAAGGARPACTGAPAAGSTPAERLRCSARGGRGHLLASSLR